jgi:KDO2-lipid IV(A) lauroyltransferase
MDYLVYLIALSAGQLLRWLPLRVALKVGAALGRLAYVVDRRHRRITQANLNLALGREKSAEELRRIAGECYANLGRSVAEFCHLPSVNKQNLSQWVSYEGLDNFISAYKRGKGVLFITAHFGNWELLAYAQALIGYPSNIVIRPLDNKYLDRVVNQYRTRNGNRVIPKKNAVKEILRSLHQGQPLGILIDQNVSVGDRVFVDFFGRPASTLTAPAILAQRTGAAVIPAFIIRRPEGGHKIVFEPEIVLQRSGNRQQDIQINMQRFTQVVEKYVRRYPEQWFWMHRRWKTRPQQHQHPTTNR